MSSRETVFAGILREDHFEYFQGRDTVEAKKGYRTVRLIPRDGGIVRLQYDVPVAADPLEIATITRDFVAESLGIPLERIHIYREVVTVEQID